jgi:hypothetical protein
MNSDTRTLHPATVTYDTAPTWARHFITSAQVERAGSSSSFRRAVHSGTFVRLAPGTYLPAEIFAALGVDARFRAHIVAIEVGADAHRVFSHMFAAALWRLPVIGTWPARAETLVNATSGGQSRVTHRAHADGIPADRVIIDGCIATSLARTVIDVARTQQLSTAVAMADFALRPRGSKDTGIFTARVTLDELYRELAAHASSRGIRKAELVLLLADGLSGSPGESLSRVGIHVLGFPAPILQQQFRDAEGVMFVDFWWPEFNLIGEFDGFGKYVREELTKGKTTAEVVMEEKRREDRLRRLGPSVTRWDWPVARSLPLLETRLREAGLR